MTPLDNIDDAAGMLAIREGLKALYSVIKGADEDIRFAFVTGISKFGKVSMFSGMNNLNDLTLYPDYSAICGYTDADLDSVFAPELPGVAREQVKRWYNGYNWFVNNKIAQYEGYYASVFYSYFAALGFDLRVEDATNHGRIDMTVILPNHIYLFEFKVVELLPEGRALQQLQDKAYADKYRALGLPISLIGVEFSRESRNVAGFEVAQLGA